MPPNVVACSGFLHSNVHTTHCQTTCASWIAKDSCSQTLRCFEFGTMPNYSLSSSHVQTASWLCLNAQELATIGLFIYAAYTNEISKLVLACCFVLSFLSEWCEDFGSREEIWAVSYQCSSIAEIKVSVSYSTNLRQFAGKEELLLDLSCRQHGNLSLEVVANGS